MEKLTILRLFFCFPLAGLMLPDAGVLVSKFPGSIPLSHIIVETALMLCILLCSVALFYNKKRNQAEANNTGEASFS